MLSQKIQVLRLLYVFMESDKVPQAAIYGTNSANARIIRRIRINTYIGGDLPIGRDILDEGFQGLSLTVPDLLIFD